MTWLQPRRSGELAPRNAIADALKQRDWGYVIVWEFQVHAGKHRRFEEVYGSDGDWARFFRQDTSYIGTELIQSRQAHRTYMVLDLWTSAEAYDEFRKKHAAEYEALDRTFENLRAGESEIGRFARVRGAKSLGVKKKRRSR